MHCGLRDCPRGNLVAVQFLRSSELAPYLAFVQGSTNRIPPQAIKAPLLSSSGSSLLASCKACRRGVATPESSAQLVELAFVQPFIATATAALPDLKSTSCTVRDRTKLAGRQCRTFACSTR